MSNIDLEIRFEDLYTPSIKASEEIHQDASNALHMLTSDENFIKLISYLFHSVRLEEVKNIYGADQENQSIHNLAALNRVETLLANLLYSRREIDESE